MGNLCNGDEIIIEYTYMTETAYSNKSNVFYIPTFISPRYGGEYLVCNKDHHIKAKVTIHNFKGYAKPVNKNVGVRIEDKIVIFEYDSNDPIEQDIEINYQTEPNSYCYQFEIKEYQMALTQFFPECHEEASSTDFVFVLDCSGSMTGDRIKNSRKAIIECLKQMPNNIKFNILQYGSEFKWYSESMLISNEDNIYSAIKYCENIQANMGGTETENALRMVLSKCKNAILITDGDTCDNSSLHELCKQFCRLSVLGIGSGINRYNIKTMAMHGHGIALFSQTEDDIIENINRIFHTMSVPVIHDPKFNWAENFNNLTTNHPIISGETYIGYAILENLVEKLTLKGTNMVLSVESLPNDFFDAKYLACLIAKRIIQENCALPKEQLTKLAVDFGIITPYTSFVAVGKEDIKIIGKEPEMNLSIADPQLMHDLTSNPSDAQQLNICSMAYTDCSSYNHRERKNNHRRTFKTNKTETSDYLFDYFMNEDKFNNELKTEWDGAIKQKLCRNTITESTIQVPYQSYIGQQKESEQPDLCRNTLKESTIQIPYQSCVDQQKELSFHDMYRALPKTVNELGHKKKLSDVGKILPQKIEKDWFDIEPLLAAEMIRETYLIEPTIKIGSNTIRSSYGRTHDITDISNPKLKVSPWLGYIEQKHDMNLNILNLSDDKLKEYIKISLDHSPDLLSDSGLNFSRIKKFFNKKTAFFLSSVLNVIWMPDEIANDDTKRSIYILCLVKSYGSPKNVAYLEKYMGHNDSYSKIIPNPI